jgi:NAD(P)-dependent dehydrogenase (short-subunit alcohol dehydrogenase family)
MAKSILITGAGGGIGRVTAVEFAKRGWRVAACDFNEQSCAETVAEIRDGGGEADAFLCDVGDTTQVQQVITDVVGRYGRIDAAFNNAGIPAFRIPLADVREEDWHRVVRTNLTGTFLCMKYEILQMLEQGGGGCIVNNSSVFGVGGGLSAPYCSTKHGISGLTKSAAIAYAEKGIRVNGVCPGLIEAGMGIRSLTRPTTDPKALIASAPINRTGTALEVAYAVMWLCSDEATFVHGHMLAVDGGYGSRG